MNYSEDRASEWRLQKHSTNKLRNLEFDDDLVNSEEGKTNNVRTHNFTEIGRSPDL